MSWRHWPSVLPLDSPSDDFTLSPEAERALSSEKEGPELDLSAVRRRGSSESELLCASVQWIKAQYASRMDKVNEKDLHTDIFPKNQCLTPRLSLLRYRC